MKKFLFWQKGIDRDVLKSNLWGMFALGILVFIDMLTKIVADAYFSQAGAPNRIDLIPGYLDLQIKYNEGMAFSIGADASPEVKMAVVAGTGLLFVGLLVFFFTLDRRRTWMRWALIFIVGGGIGNFIDRSLYLANPAVLAGVRDMVRLKIWFMDFGVCNFADFFVVGGSIAFALAVIFFDGMAMIPLTKKYKAMAIVMEEQEKEKEALKKAKKEEKAKK